MIHWQFWRGFIQVILERLKKTIRKILVKYIIIRKKKLVVIKSITASWYIGNWEFNYYFSRKARNCVTKENWILNTNYVWIHWPINKNSSFQTYALDHGTSLVSCGNQICIFKINTLKKYDNYRWSVGILI